MVDLLMVFAFVMLPILWVFSLVMIRDWKHFWVCFLAHCVLLIGYSTIILNSKTTGGYGLNVFFNETMAVLIHLLVGFFSMYVRLKILKSRTLVN